MRNENYTNVQIDWYTRVCLTAISVLLTLLVIGLWADTVRPAGAEAAEQFQPALTQRGNIIKGQQMSDKKLDELMALLKSGKVRVQIVGEGGKAASPGGVSNVVPKKDK